MGSQSRTTGSPCGPGYPRSISLSSPKTTARAALSSLQIDQQLPEGPRLRVSPELADPVGSVEVREDEDVAEFSPSSWRQGFEALTQRMFHLLEGHGPTLVHQADGPFQDVPLPLRRKVAVT